MGQENLAICKSEGDLYNLEHIGKHWGPCTFVRSLEYRESGTGGSLYACTCWDHKLCTSYTGRLLRMCAHAQQSHVYVVSALDVMFLHDEM